MERKQDGLFYPQRRHPKSKRNNRLDGHGCSYHRITPIYHPASQDEAGMTKLRLNVNTMAIVKLANLISNSLILTSNVYLLGNDIRRQIRDKKTETLSNKLKLTAEAASAVASLAKVVVNTLEQR